MYIHGDAVPQDPPAAAKWFACAAEQGHTLAQFQLATWLAEGVGVTQNNRDAGVWFCRAVANFSPVLQIKIGLRFHHAEMEADAGSEWLFLKSIALLRHRKVSGRPSTGLMSKRSSHRTFFAD